MNFSLIIPTYNRPKSLKNCLDSVFSSDYPERDYEVIVIIDGNCRNSFEVVEDYKQHDNLIIMNQIPNKGPAAARNLGIKNSRGKIIGFTDDDCILSKTWIKQMVETHLNNDDIAAVGGDSYPPPGDMKVVVSQYISNSGIQFMVGKNLETLYFPTCNVSVKKSVLEKFSFDESFPFPGGEDLEYFWRLYKNNCRFIYNESIILLHNRDSSLNQFLKQQYNYGKGNMLVFAKHRDHPILKKILTMKLPLLFLKFFECLFIFFPYIGLHEISERIIKKYRIKGMKNRLKIFSYLALQKFFNFLGSIRAYFNIGSIHREG